MEFLFLNEETQIENSYEQTKAFAESVGVDVSDISNQTLDEVMLEAVEGCHEAEMTAMQEEFALFQESVGHEEILQEEGALKKIGDTLKKWWKAIKEWCVKTWTKIVHWFWVAVQWMRKTIQSAIQKVSGSKNVYLPESLATAAGSDPLESKAIVDKIEGLATMAIYVSGDKDGVVKMKDFEKAFADYKKKQLKVFEGYGKEKEKGKMTPVPVATWKKWMDNALKEYENCKKAVEKANSNCQKTIKENDKALEAFYKDGKGDKAAILNNGKRLRMVSILTGKFGGLFTSRARKFMSVLFSKASFKNKEDKEEFKK
jgi:hypothetical protein